MDDSIFNRKAPFLMAAILLIMMARWAGAQTTEFTYQGKKVYSPARRPVSRGSKRRK